MQSVQSIVASQASAAALNLGRAATEYVSAQNVVAIPLVSEYGKKLSEGAAVAAKNVAQVAKDHPYIASAVGSGLAVAAAPGLIAAPALAAAGFGSEGIILASTAASIQSVLGPITAGGAFATLTSAGMGGYGVAVVNGVVSGAGGAVAAMGGIAGVRSWWTQNSEPPKEGSQEEAHEEEEESRK